MNAVEPQARREDADSSAMRVLLLGTGDAAGWPNPFCDCTSCTAERAAGRSRAQTSALVDDVILLDCGPTVPLMANRSAIALGSVEHVLITHGHPDHCDPQLLLARHWSTASSPLHIWAPPAALASFAHWIGPADPIVLHAVVPAQDSSWDLQTRHGEYRITAIPAAHGSPTGAADDLADEALLYAITSPRGPHMLFATDTGPLPAQARALLAGRFDLVLIEQTFGLFTDHGTGHHDVPSLQRELDGLRAAGHVDDASRVVAIHLGHHNPPLPELQGIMADMGVQVLADGTELRVPAPGVLPSQVPSRTLVLGGTRSGKSAWAEERARTLVGMPAADRVEGSVVVIATGPQPDAAGDPEWADRVRAHQERRPSAWRTVETADLAGALRSARAGTCCIVDCLGTWLTRLLDDAHAWESDAALGDRERTRSLVSAACDDVIAALRESPAHVVLVSNEVGMSLVPMTASGRLFTDLLGTVNRRISAACADVVLMVAGRALPLSADPLLGRGTP